MPEKRIVIEQHGNPNAREYHLTSLISDSYLALFERPFTTCSKNDLKRVGPTGKAIVCELLAINGADRVHLDAYSVTVLKATAFDWDEIERAILSILIAVAYEDRREDVHLYCLIPPRDDFADESLARPAGYSFSDIAD